VPYVRKPFVKIPSDEWGPWIAAHFQNQEARDRFVLYVATAEGNGCAAEPANGDSRGAWVRWRPGRFLGLNDIAYAHGGRIVANVGHRRAEPREQ
jgi:hypothetical protein